MVVRIKGAIIKLVSMAGTGFFYTTRKNPKNLIKLMLRKYDPVIRQHVMFKVIFATLCFIVKKFVELICVSIS